jgi:hypothetical protein
MLRGVPLVRPDATDLRVLLIRRAAPFAGLSPAAGDELLSVAARHGLLASVAGRLPPDDADLRTRFERLATGARLHDARLREVLEEVLAALASAGVVPVALKGPVLADRIYPDPALRAASDLDLLVPEEQLERSVAVLLSLGFHRGPAIVDAYQRRHHHHLQLIRSPGPDVELHFRPQSAFGARLPAAAFLARAIPHRTARGTPLRILAPEDELIALAVHAAGHLLARGEWVMDLILFVERHPGLDWRAVEERAAAYRCRRALAHALVRARELGAPVPGGLLAIDATRRSLSEALARASRARDGRRAAAFQMAFQLALSDRPWRAPGQVLLQAWWVVRRRAHLLARLLTRSRRRILGPR